MQGEEKTSPSGAFGHVLRSARIAAGMSQEALSFESGVQRNFISRIEIGQNQPTITTIFKLAAALQVPPADLIRDTEKALKRRR